MGHRHMAFPVTFLVHERRTRACWPFVDEPNDDHSVPRLDGLGGENW
jgi:hypothetical protein